MAGRRALSEQRTHCHRAEKNDGLSVARERASSSRVILEEW